MKKQLALRILTMLLASFPVVSRLYSWLREFLVDNGLMDLLSFLIFFVLISRQPDWIHRFRLVGGIQVLGLDRVCDDLELGESAPENLTDYTATGSCGVTQQALWLIWAFERPGG